MKDTILFITILFFCSTYGGKTDMAEKIIRTMRKCSRQHHLVLKDIEGAIKHGDLPQSEDGKCFVTCTLKEFGLVSSDNKFDPEKSFALNALRFKNPDDVQKANDVTKKCAEELTVEFENPCDFGIAVANCGVKHSREAGIINYNLW